MIIDNTAKIKCREARKRQKIAIGLSITKANRGNITFRFRGGAYDKRNIRRTASRLGIYA